jgi:hypothetical protein
MKNKITAILAALISAAYVSAVEVNENLSINGFLDGSFQHEDKKQGAENDQSLGLDEAEIDFLFNVGGVSGEIHIDNQSNGGGDSAGDWDLEQAHFSYGLESGFTVTMGRFGSALGLEREDPGGIYTFSRAYSTADERTVAQTRNFNLGNIDAGGDIQLQEGLRASYASDVFGLAASLVNSDEASGELNEDELDFELALSYTGVENLTIGGGAYFDNDETSEQEIDAINVHALYNAGKALVGFEYTELDANGVEGEAYLVMVDYDVSDKLGVALRYSSEELDQDNDYDKFTIAPNYAITESLGAIIEYSDIENDTIDTNLLAIELTFTF